VGLVGRQDWAAGLGDRAWKNTVLRGPFVFCYELPKEVEMINNRSPRDLLEPAATLKSEVEEKVHARWPRKLHLYLGKVK
jgi:hypothetical protein